MLVECQAFLRSRRRLYPQVCATPDVDECLKLMLGESPTFNPETLIEYLRQCELLDKI